MFIKWALFLIFLSIFCYADLSIKQLDLKQTLHYNKTISGPFSVYFQKHFKKPNTLDFNILHFKEIKAFIQKLKFSKQIAYLSNIQYIPHSTKTDKLKFSTSDSWSLGPSGGTLASYLLAKNIRLIGKTAQSYVLTKINLTNNESIQESFFKQPTTDFGLGFGYRSKVSKVQITLRAFYELHLVSDWESFIQLAQLKNQNTISFDDLYFQGLSCILRFDF